MTFSAVFEDSGILDLARYDRDVLDALADAGGVIYWCRDGEWRKVPCGILRDTLAHMAVQERMVDRGRLTQVQPRASRIHWQQTVTPFLPPAADTERILRPSPSPGPSQSPSRTGD